MEISSQKAKAKQTIHSVHQFRTLIVHATASGRIDDVLVEYADEQVRSAVPINPNKRFQIIIFLVRMRNQINYLLA